MIIVRFLKILDTRYFLIPIKCFASCLAFAADSEKKRSSAQSAYSLISTAESASVDEVFLFKRSS